MVIWWVELKLLIYEEQSVEMPSIENKKGYT